MSERYYSKDYDELYYIFDSHTVSEEAVDERIEYDGYNAFEDSMTGDTVVNRLNELNDENEQSKMMITTLSNIVLENEDLRKGNKELTHENVNIMSDLDYYLVKSRSCEKGLFEKDRQIAKLEKENQYIKNTIQTMLNNERTHIGQSVLKQLWEVIQ